MHYETDEKKWALREEILKRNADIHPNRAKILDDLGEKWAATKNWRIRQDVGTAATKIRDAAEVIAEAEKYDPWQVAESMIELRDEIQDYLAHFAIATGEMSPPHEFRRENEHPADDEDRLIREDGSDDESIIAHGNLMEEMLAEDAAKSGQNA